VSLEQWVTAAQDRIPRRRRHSPTRLLPARDSAKWVQQWQKRDRVWEALRASPQSFTPSRLRDQQRGGPLGEPRGGPEPEKARLIGTLAHRILELWDFRRDPRELDGYVQTLGRRILPAEWTPDAEAVLEELRDMFKAFVESAPYAELRCATILGREVPFTMVWPPEGQTIDDKGAETTGRSRAKRGQTRLSSGNRFSTIMEGVIDLFYRVDGRLWVADYKTDRVPEEALAGRAADYRSQGRAYRQAVARCLAVDQVGWKVIFLRHGRAVEG
jgi:ATP-dependent helicase/nuclease subunit A